MRCLAHGSLQICSMKSLSLRFLLPFLLTLLLTLPVTAQSQATFEIDGFPVSLDHQELFVIQTQVGSFSAEERAQVITTRLETIAKDPSISLEGLVIETDDATRSLVLNNRVLVTITQADARAARQEQQQLAIRYRQAIESAVTQYRQARDRKGIVKGAVYSLAATLVLLIMVWCIGRWYPKVRDWVCSLRHTRIPDIQLQEVKLISAHQTVNLLVGGVKLLRTGLLIGLIYTYITVVLSFFPWTQSYGSNLLKSLWAAVYPALASAIAQLPNLLIIAVIIFVTNKLRRFITYIFQAMEAGDVTFPGFHREWIRPTHKLMLLLLFVMAFVVAFPYIPGSSSPAFRGFSIVLGVLASLGSSTAVTNAIAGIILIYTRSFEIGDRIQIGDAIGHVEERSMLVTRIRTRKNALITVPNATVLASNVTNFSALARQTQTPLVLSTTITLGYDVSWQQAQEVLLAAAELTSGVLPAPAPFVLQTSLDDFYVSHELNVYVDPSTKDWELYSLLHRNILDLCNRAGIEILSPHYSAIRDGNQITLPESYLAKDYQPSGFRLQLPNMIKPWEAVSSPHRP